MWKWDSSEVHLELENVSKVFGSVSAVKGVNLSIYRGEFFSLLGPSGSGKSTILRLIAGLERPDEGIIRIEGKVVADRKVWVPPEKRGVGLVFQNYALFPQMTVFENVAYGISYLPKQEVKKRVRELLEMVGLAHKEKHYPHQLSGGEQQRVALARALAVAPKVMLLDEPFSNLDADLRRDLRKQTKKILKELGTTTILVTHDQEEAFSLSDRVGVINGGVLEQVGTPFEVYHRPATRFVADFVGLADFYKGKIEGDVLTSEIGNFPVNGQWEGKSKEVEIMIRPDDVDFEPDPQGEAVISEVEFLGAEIIYTLSLPSGPIIHSVKNSKEFYPVGTKVKVKIDPNHIVIF